MSYHIGGGDWLEELLGYVVDRLVTLCVEMEW